MFHILILVSFHVVEMGFDIRLSGMHCCLYCILGYFLT